MLAMLLGFLFPVPELATTETYPGYRWGPADAPIRMRACEASAEIFRGVARSSSLRYGAGFAIEGARVASRVRLRFTFADTRWQRLRTIDETLEGTFTPGAQVLRTHRYGGDFRRRDVIRGAGAVLCSPIAVDFVDGTSWRWTPPPTPYPLPAPTEPPGAAPFAPVDAPRPAPGASAVPVPERE